MDASLSSRLNHNDFSNYNGLGQKIATRVLLTSPDSATIFVNLPTGCGKTLLIHALMLFSEHQRLILVIVPTVALAIEQAQRVTQVLQATNQYDEGPFAWYGGQEISQRERLKERLKSGNQRILFCSPEAARLSLLPVLFQLASKGQLGALFVDEAHLVDQWGAGFRPDFQVIAPLVNSLSAASPNGIRKVLMSATFNLNTLQTLKNIFTQPGEIPLEVNANFLRPEISYELTKSPTFHAQKEKVLELLQQMPRPLILYVTKQEDAEQWYQTLSEHGYNRVGLFYGKTITKDREALIKQWQHDQLDIMVATSAFGVGMDKNDVRSVLHACVPENIDRYYQECGRSGRDGNASLAHLVYEKMQIPIAQSLNKERIISTEKGFLRWNAMCQEADKESDTVQIDLRTMRLGIQYDSDANMAWNWRTLLLMKRAGFIELHFSALELPRDETLTEDQFQDCIQNFYSHVRVQILNDGHLDKSVWDDLIETQRLSEMKSRQEGFRMLKQWLDNPNKLLCDSLSEFYTLYGYLPEPACGGCPGCRANEDMAQTPTLGAFVQPVRGWVKKNGGVGDIRRVSYNGTGVHIRSLLQEWNPLIDYLLRKGLIKAIRARSDVHHLLNKILSINTFWCAIEPGEKDSIWDELILVMPDETKVPQAELSDFNQIFFIPEHLKDPQLPHRRWVDCDQYAVQIEDFKREFIYVHH